MNNQSNNQIYIMFNGLGVLTAYVMMSMGIWYAPVDLSTKGFWGICIFMLTLALVNLVKYRLDERIQADRLNQLETAKNEKIIKEYITEE